MPTPALSRRPGCGGAILLALIIAIIAIIAVRVYHAGSGEARW